MKILAIETSCDDTACAVVSADNKVLSNIVSSQIDIHKQYNGIVPELASRSHLKNINFVVKEALEKAKCKLKNIDAFAVTVSPGLKGSLIVGSITAKVFAYFFNKPLVPVNHLKAHIWANFLSYKNTSFKPKFPAVVLLASGGHTELYLMKSFTSIKLLGRTRDDAVGEAYDKVGSLLGLGYPGGPVIDKVGKEIRDRVNMPRPFLPNTFDFSFSGVKTAVLNYTKKVKNIKDYEKKVLAASFQDSVVEVLVKKIVQATNKFKAKSVMLSGGVACNSHLRLSLKEALKTKKVLLNYPLPVFCTDNAAMVGARALFDVKLNGLGFYKSKMLTDLNYFEPLAN